MIFIDKSLGDIQKTFNIEQNPFQYTVMLRIYEYLRPHQVPFPFFITKYYWIHQRLHYFHIIMKILSCYKISLKWIIKVYSTVLQMIYCSTDPSKGVTVFSRLTEKVFRWTRGMWDLVIDITFKMDGAVVKAEGKKFMELLSFRLAQLV